MDIKDLINHDISRRRICSRIQEKYGITSFQFYYYKKLNEKWNLKESPLNNKPDPNEIKDSLVDDLVTSINKLKKEKQEEK